MTELLAILARYDGTCDLCHHRIVAHEHSIVELDGEWVHADCAEDEGHEIGRLPALGAPGHIEQRRSPELTLQLGAWSDDA